MQQEIQSILSYGRVSLDNGSAKVPSEFAVRPEHQSYTSSFKESLPLLGAALFVSTTLCLFLPHQIYTQNLEEYAVSFETLLIHLVLATTGLTLVLCAPALMLRHRNLLIYTSIVFAVGLLLWIQGNLLAASYGALDGRELDFGAQTWRSIYEIPLWISIIFGSIYFSRHLHPLINTIAYLVLVLSLIVLLFGSMTRKETAKYATVIDPSFYSLSAEKNVLHILLDGFGSVTFENILQSDTTLRDDLKGFTFFRDTVGSFSTTHPAVASALTGEIFDFKQPLSKFLEERMQHKTLDLKLQAEGYNTALVSTSRLCLYMARRCYSAMNLDGNYADANTQAIQLIGMSLFRASPHVLKPSVYQGGSWISFTPISASEKALLQKPYLWFQFLNAYIDKLELDIASITPRYRLLHLEFPHPPYIFDQQCNVVERQQGNFQANRQQSLCALSRVRVLLNRLRSLGIYDSTVIAIHADHGSHHELQAKWPRAADRPTEWFASRSSPLLLLKPRNANGQLQTSLAQATLSDITPTLLELAGLPARQPTATSRSLVNLTQDTKRIRYHWGSSVWKTDQLNPRDAKLFRIEGDHLNPEAWHFVTSSGDLEVNSTESNSAKQ